MVRFTTGKKAPIEGWQKGSVVGALATKPDHQRSVPWVYTAGEKQLPLHVWHACSPTTPSKVNKTLGEKKHHLLFHGK